MQYRMAHYDSNAQLTTAGGYRGSFRPGSGSRAPMWILKTDEGSQRHCAPTHYGAVSEVAPAASSASFLAE